MLTTIKWITVVCIPTLTKQHLDQPFAPLNASEVDSPALWNGYAKYLMEIYGEYHLTERIRQPDEEFFQELCYVELQGLVDTEQLLDVYERLTKDHHAYILEALDCIAREDCYLKSIQAQWHMERDGRQLPMLFFESSTLFDFIEGAPPTYPVDEE